MLTLEYRGEGELSYATKDSVGFDLRSNQEVELEPGENKLVGTGLFIKNSKNLMLPFGLNEILVPELQIRPRSGLAYKNKITVLNSPGTIDPDYRDEIKVNLFNAGKEKFTVTKGMKIAQAVCCLTVRVPDIKIEQVERTGGHGSTGV